MARSCRGHREGLCMRFLAEHGWDGAVAKSLAGDGSVRRYTRLLRGANSCLLMECPPELSIEPFLKVDALLRKLGLSAPEILAADASAGLALVEDFGDDTFSRLLGDGADETALY